MNFEHRLRHLLVEDMIKVTENRLCVLQYLKVKKLSLPLPYHTLRGLGSQWGKP